MFAKVKNFINIARNTINTIHSIKWIQLLVFSSYFVFLSLLILLRDFFAISLNQFIFVILLAFCLFLLNKKKAYFILFFTLPFSSSLAELYILIFALIYMFLLEFKEHKIIDWLGLFSFPILLFVLEIILSHFYGTISLRVALRIFVLLSLLAIVFYDSSADSHSIYLL